MILENYHPGRLFAAAANAQQRFHRSRSNSIFVEHFALDAEACGALGHFLCYSGRCHDVRRLVPEPPCEVYRLADRRPRSIAASTVLRPGQSRWIPASQRHGWVRSLYRSESDRPVTAPSAITCAVSSAADALRRRQSKANAAQFPVPGAPTAIAAIRRSARRSYCSGLPAPINSTRRVFNGAG